MWYHPKYYKELRKLRNKLDQAISHANSTRGPSDVRSGPGLKQQSSSDKPQAPSDSNSSQQDSIDKQQASSSKHRGSSFKPQASSARIPDPGKSFTDLSLRSSTKINELRGCFTWKLI